MEDLSTLIAKVRDGDERSFRRLYERLVTDLYRFVYRYVKSDSIAEEIVQDSFVTLWTHRCGLDEKKNVRSYLFEIAYHQIIREFRRQLKNPLLKDYIEYLSEAVETEKLSIDFDTYHNAVRKAVLSLPPRQREIFDLNKDIGLSVSDIAERLGISEQVVRNQLSAAMKSVRGFVSKFL